MFGTKYAKLIPYGHYFDTSRDPQEGCVRRSRYSDPPGHVVVRGKWVDRGEDVIAVANRRQSDRKETARLLRSAPPQESHGSVVLA